jgi:hypothetical protein
LRGDADPPAVESFERDLEALALASKQVFLGDTAVLKNDLRGFRRAQAELVFDLADDEPRGTPLDQEGRDAALAPARVGDRVDQSEIGAAAVGGKDFGAVQQIAARRSPGLRPNRARVGTRRRFGERVAAGPLSACDPRQIALDLHLTAVA